MLAKKVYELMRKKEKIIMKKGIPSLQELAKEAVADNFELYPHLKGISSLVKDEVKSLRLTNRLLPKLE